MPKIRILVFFVALAGLGSVAAAQPYESPMRAQCEAELEKDARWRAELSKTFEFEFHDREAGQMVTNQKHVVWAYAAILSFLVLFVAVMVARQRKLVGEIDRLRADVDRAARE